MGLYRRDQVWWMSFTYNGKQIRRSTEVTAKKLPEKIYYKVITQIAEGKWFDVRPFRDNTFGEMMEKYLTEYSPTKAPKTHMRDKSLASHLNRFFEHYKLPEITPKDIYAYKVEREKEGAAPKTINNELVLMGHAFNLAMREWIDSNPVGRISKEKVINEIVRWLTSDEERKLLEASPDWLKEIIVFAINTGLRQGEILALTWNRVDFTGKTLTILEQKNKSKDTLPLNMNAMGILIGRDKVRSIKNRFVFYNGNGNIIDRGNLSRTFRSAVKKAGIEKFRFHDLRHTFATRLIQNGVDIYTVQRLGRWKTIQMVLRYAHHHAESLRGGVEILDRMPNGIITFYHNRVKAGLRHSRKPLILLVAGVGFEPTASGL